MEKILLISNYPGGFGVLVFVCIFFFLKLLSLPKEPKKLQKYVEPEVVFFFFFLFLILAKLTPNLTEHSTCLIPAVKHIKKLWQSSKKT